MLLSHAEKDRLLECVICKCLGVKLLHGAPGFWMITSGWAQWKVFCFSRALFIHVSSEEPTHPPPHGSPTAEQGRGEEDGKQPILTLSTSDTNPETLIQTLGRHRHSAAPRLAQVPHQTLDWLRFFISPLIGLGSSSAPWLAQVLHRPLDWLNHYQQQLLQSQYAKPVLGGDWMLLDYVFSLLLDYVFRFLCFQMNQCFFGHYSLVGSWCFIGSLCKQLEMLINYYASLIHKPKRTYNQPWGRHCKCAAFPHPNPISGASRTLFLTTHLMTQTMRNPAGLVDSWEWLHWYYWTVICEPHLWTLGLFSKSKPQAHFRIV